jgi:glutamyl-tRNA reductase
MPVVIVGISHRTAPVQIRERFAFAEPTIPQILERMRASGIADEGVLLSTCNRVELYAATSTSAPDKLAQLREYLLHSKEYRDSIGEEIYCLEEPKSLEHLFRVACGLDSMVLGETEILGQLKHAYELAFQHKHTGGFLNKAFQKAFHTAKQVRTETQIQRGAVSVANVAVELAEKIFDSLKGLNVMVIGAGDTSEKTAKALLSRGAGSLWVANRTFEKAQTLASELGGHAVSFDNWTSEFNTLDVVVSSTSAPHYVLDRATLEPLMHSRKNRALLLVDIAVPRDIDPAVNLLENVYLYNIDDLQMVADDYLKQRQREVAVCEQIIREKVSALLDGRQRSGKPVFDPAKESPI